MAYKFSITNQIMVNFTPLGKFANLRGLVSKICFYNNIDFGEENSFLYNEQWSERAPLMVRFRNRSR